MIRKIIPRSEFSRNVITLMTGTAVAQAIPIAISPILTRIYSPDEFGLFAIFMAIVSILGVVSTGRYELAIMLPKKDEDALYVAISSFFICSLLSVVILAIVVVSGDALSILLDKPKIKKYLYLVPFFIFVSGSYQTLNYWLNRKKRYKTISLNRTVQSGTSNFSQLGFGVLGQSYGLIVGTLMGQIFSLLFLFRSSDGLKPKSFKIKKIKLFSIMRKYSDFPKFDVPSSLINIAANQMPSILLASIFGGAVSGYYYLTQRVLQAPITLISSSVLDVFKQKASEDYKSYGNCKSIFRKTFLTLTLISLPPSLVLYIYIEDLFSIIFGEQWKESGTYAKILIPALCLRFIVNPLSFMIYVAQKQVVNLFGMSLLFIMVLVGIIISDTSTEAIASISISFVTVYLLYLFVSARIAKAI
ncbi:lipopolysaccharide biosynthesis protein [Grimontia celer]|nr:oligosaccharide flippase family protein [Grimontia celer]